MGDIIIETVFDRLKIGVDFVARNRIPRNGVAREPTRFDRKERFLWL